MTEYGYDPFSSEEEEETGRYAEEEAEEGPWPEILSPGDAGGTPLIRLMEDYGWAKWLLTELTMLMASENDDRVNMLNLNFRSGVLLNGEPGNGVSVIARSILGYLRRDWISLNRIDWMSRKKEEFLSDLRKCLAESTDSRLCILVEDLSCCSYADAVMSLLSEYAEAVEPQNFFMIILENEWKIPEYLLEKLLICTFRNPDEKERERFLRHHLDDPLLLLSSGEKKLILEKTAGFSYADMDRLIHWLRLLQWENFQKKYEESERDAMSENEYRRAFGECELGTEQLEVLLGLLRKDSPSERAARPAGMTQSVPMAQPDYRAAAQRVANTSEADRTRSKEEELSAYINGQSIAQRMEIFREKNQAISNPIGDG